MSQLPYTIFNRNILSCSDWINQAPQALGKFNSVLPQIPTLDFQATRDEEGILLKIHLKKSLKSSILSKQLKV